MTPREPDRFEEKAKELCLTEWRSIAAALRAEHDDAMERAAQVADESREDGRCIAFAIRALMRQAPAAAPAARQAKCPNKDPYCSCQAPMDPAPAAETIICGPTCPGHPPSEPAPLLPRVLAALDIPSVLGNRERLALAAELRAYIAEEEGKK